jgi:hypothetical protein
LRNPVWFFSDVRQANFQERRPFPGTRNDCVGRLTAADPKAAARNLVEIANATGAVQNGRISIEKLNGPFLFKEGGNPAEYLAGLELAIARGWL